MRPALFFATGADFVFAAAHLRFAASAMAFRPAAVILRFFAVGFAVGASGAVFFGAALAALIAAHLRFAASAIALRPAELILRLFGAAAVAGAVAAFDLPLPGGRPPAPWSLQRIDRPGHAITFGDEQSYNLFGLRLQKAAPGATQ